MFFTSELKTLLLCGHKPVLIRIYLGIEIAMNAMSFCKQIWISSAFNGVSNIVTL